MRAGDAGHSNGRGSRYEPMGRLRTCRGFSLGSATFFESPYELELSVGFGTLLSLTASLLSSDKSGDFSSSVASSTFSSSSVALQSCKRGEQMSWGREEELWVRQGVHECWYA